VYLQMKIRLRLGVANAGLRHDRQEPRGERRRESANRPDSSPAGDSVFKLIYGRLPRPQHLRAFYDDGGPTMKSNPELGVADDPDR